MEDDHNNQSDHTWRHMIDTRRQLRRLMGHLEVQSPQGGFVFLLCLIIAWAVYAVARTHTELEEGPARALFMLTAAALLWATEAAPAFAVGILVIALDVMLLARPNSELMLRAYEWESSVAVLGHPLIWLFFGGFVLAAGTARTGLDRWLAIKALGRFGTGPASLLAGVMTVTFGFSMFMSNTATTALMLALLAPLSATLSKDDPFRKALMLGTAVAANLGGMGSLIGTPPNAIAAGALADLPGQSIGFLQWLAYGLPPATLLSIIGWRYLLHRYPPTVKSLDVNVLLSSGRSEDTRPRLPRWRRGVVAITGLTTVLLWMTSEWHKTPTAVISLLPIVVFTTMSVLGPTEIRSLPWDVLFLIAGGLALGEAIRTTGLATWMVQAVPVASLGPIGLALGLSFLCAALSNFMSNTAAANVLIPIAISLAPGFEASVAVPLALAASAAMCLPIATPPNALVFASGAVTSTDFLRPGLLIGVLTPVLGVLWVTLLW